MYIFPQFSKSNTTPFLTFLPMLSSSPPSSPVSQKICIVSQDSAISTSDQISTFKRRELQDYELITKLLLISPFAHIPNNDTEEDFNIQIAHSGFLHRISLQYKTSHLPCIQLKCINLNSSPSRYDRRPLVVVVQESITEPWFLLGTLAHPVHTLFQEPSDFHQPLPAPRYTRPPSTKFNRSPMSPAKSPYFHSSPTSSSQVGPVLTAPSPILSRHAVYLAWLPLFIFSFFSTYFRVCIKKLRVPRQFADSSRVQA